MSELITVTRQADNLQGYQLTNAADMVAALQYLSAGGYTGHINCASTEGSAVWTMGLQSPGQNVSQSATIGDWIIIKNNAVASVVPAAQFTQLYNV